MFGLATVSLVQPLYTFGKIDSLREAAAHGIAVSQAQVNERATKVAMLVYEAYYGSLLAVSLENLALEIGDQLNSSLEKIRRQLDAGAPGVDNIDRLKLETFQGELEKQLNDIREGKALAQIGLRTLLNLDPTQPIELTDKTLEPQVREPVSLEQYLTDANQLRPEFTQAREGVKATWFADSTCDTCRCALLLVENDHEMKAPSHHHSVDEIIFLVRGAIRMGSYEFGAGTALSIPGNARYSFTGLAGGHAFLNFRRDVSNQTNGRDEEPMLETAFARGGELVDDVR